MKTARVSIMVLVAVVLATGTIFERYRGAEWVGDHFYGSWWFAVLMGLVAVGTIVSIVQGKIWKRPAALLIHAAVPVILLGGALTTWTGEHYSITLAPGETKEGITLESFEVVNYPGTHTPMDFVSHIICDGEPFDISMNHIYRHDGYRYYQEDYDEEGRTTLSVKHDPWGIAVTYLGYALLLLGLGWLCLKRVPPLQGLKRGGTPSVGSRPRLKSIVPLGLLFLLPIAAQAAPRTLPQQTAAKMGEMYVLYKGRICPLQTFAKDFTTKLTGKATYEGLTSEQVLSGFLFYYSDWAVESEKWKVKSEKRNGEKEAIINMLLSGHGLKLFPVSDSTGTIGWYAQNDNLPVNVSEEEYIFIRKQQGYCQEQVVKGDYEELERVFAKTRVFQERRAAVVLPSPARLKAERLYNALTTGRWLAMLAITLGLISFAYALFRIGRGKAMQRWIKILLTSYLTLLTIFLILIFMLRWIAGGHVPMAGGFDSMNLMAIVIGIIGLLLMRRHSMALPVAVLTMGFCLLVAMMSGSNPPVTNLMPVLSSPLLCFHVAVIMMSYALFFFLMMIGIAGLISGNWKAESEKFYILGKKMLYPAVFLLTLGIVIGALWANISWGNYWTWDPKEVWALITLIVYVLPLHSSLRISNEPRRFFLYCSLAFFSVIVTYFGVNFFLGGIHAYN